MLANAVHTKLSGQERDKAIKHGAMTDLPRDVELVQRIAAKDEVALSELYAAYGQCLYAYALRLTGDQSQAIEDIGQTCRDMAVLSHGKVIFCGSPKELMEATEGPVWTLTCSGLERPDHDLTIVSMLHLAEGTQYRLVGSGVKDYPSAQPAQPVLEDGYVWLMKRAGQTVEMP
jgi:hypothetical protein